MPWIIIYALLHWNLDEWKFVKICILMIVAFGHNIHFDNNCIIGSLSIWHVILGVPEISSVFLLL